MRRSRLQIRPNTSRSPRDISHDTVTGIKLKSLSNKSSFQSREEIKILIEKQDSNNNNNKEQILQNSVFNKSHDSASNTSNINILNTVEKTKLQNEKNNILIDKIVKKSVSFSDLNDILKNSNEQLTANSDKSISKINTIIETSQSEKIDHNSANELSPSVNTSLEELSEENTCIFIQNSTEAEKEIKNAGKKRSKTRLNIQRNGKQQQRSLSLQSDNSEIERKKVIKEIQQDLQFSASQTFTSVNLTVNQHTELQAVTPVNSSEKKMSNKLNDIEEVSKKRNRFGKNIPERSKMTMVDLIYWNPPNNPMSQKKTENESSTILQPTEEEEEIDGMIENEELEEQCESQKETEESTPAPRLMVGPNGEIKLDEESLVIRRKAPEQIASKDVVYEMFECTYTSFRKSRPKQFWSNQETAKFFRALSIVGTDFSLMQNLFPKRSRQELKNKFKKEERINRDLVDRAIRDPQQFDLAEFDNYDEDSEDNEKQNPKKCNSKTSSQYIKTRKCQKKKLVKHINYLSEDISDDSSEIRTANHKRKTHRNIKSSNLNIMKENEIISISEDISTTVSSTDINIEREENPDVQNCNKCEKVSNKQDTKNLSEPQFLFVAGPSTNQDQVLHVYMVSPTQLIEQS